MQVHLWLGMLAGSSLLCAGCADGGPSPAGPGANVSGTPAGGAAAGTSSTNAGTSGGGHAGVGQGGAGAGAGGASAGSASGSSAGGTGGGAAGGTAGASAGTGGGPAVTCPSEPLTPGTTTRTLQIAGKSRSYELLVPSGYQAGQAAPLIVDFHGITGNGEGQRGSSTYPNVVASDGAVMAFPTGLPGPLGNAWNVGACCVDDTDDVAFAKALVADVSKLACVDPKRVYAVGFSMGGGMSHYLACHAADVFAAVAPAAFDLLEENIDDCQPARPITVVSFRSTNDQVVPYEGGYSDLVQGHPINFLGAEATLAAWAELNQCTGGAQDLGDGCQGYQASQCQAGVQVVLCTKQNGHAGGDAAFAWPVLKAHQLP